MRRVPPGSTRTHTLFPDATLFRSAPFSGRGLACLVAGLPAYVLVKVLTPGFYARKDTKTPVKTAVVVLVVNVALNFILIAYFGVVGLAIATAIFAWLNCAKIGRAHV